MEPVRFSRHKFPNLKSLFLNKTGWSLDFRVPRVSDWGEVGLEENGCRLWRHADAPRPYRRRSLRFSYTHSRLRAQYASRESKRVVSQGHVLFEPKPKPA